MKFKCNANCIVVERLKKDDWFPKSKVLKIDQEVTDPTKHTFMTAVGRVIQTGYGTILPNGEVKPYPVVVGDIILFSDTPMDTKDKVYIDYKEYIIMGISSVFLYGIEK